MNDPRLMQTNHLSRHDLRKAVLRLRLEASRQEIRHESQLIAHRYLRAKTYGQALTSELTNPKHAWLLSGGGALVLGLIGGSRSRWGKLLRLSSVFTSLWLALRSKK